MKLFRLPADIPSPGWQISHSDSLFLIGSCFTSHIGERLVADKFRTMVNPFGVLYNPASIADSVRYLLAEKQFSSEDARFHDERWFLFSHHGSFSDTDRERLIDRVNREMRENSVRFKEARVLFFTFGTARIYRLRESGQMVSNCHKLPASEFQQELLSVGEIVEMYRELLADLFKMNPGLKIVFTISPVRHWKDGAFGNQLSKAHLFTAIGELLALFKSTYYFPAYELMMDELRDYRFYAEDMIHVSSGAADYIYSRFGETFFSEDTIALISKILVLRRAAGHIPFHIHAEAYKKFLKANYESALRLKEEYPHLDLSEELLFFRHSEEKT